MLKWMGAILIVVSCGGFGFYQGINYRREERTLRELLQVMDLMECELQYRLTPLPHLCNMIAQQYRGPIGQLFQTLGKEMESQISPEVSSCMQAALIRCRNLPEQVRELLEQFGRTLGRFDLQGQMIGLDAVRMECRAKLEQMEQNRETRIRSYQTLGLCAGAALAILFV